MATQIPTKGAPGQRSSTPRKAAAKKAPPRKAAPAKKAPGKVIAKKVDKGDFSPAAARKLTDRIKAGYLGTVKLIDQAYKGRIWLALGKKNWNEYLQDEFGGPPMELPKASRMTAVAEMVDLGWSVRTIAAVTGTSTGTAGNEAKAAVEAKGGDGDDILDADVVDEDGNVIEPGEVEPQSRTVLGQDGRERTVTTAPKPTPPAPPAGEAAVALAKSIKLDLEKLTIRLENLYDHDGYVGDDRLRIDEILATPIDDLATTLGDRLPVLEPEPAG